MINLDWKSYTHDRLIANHPNGFSIIKPKEDVSRVPLSCSICDAIFRSRDDEMACREFDCCNLCAMQWAHARKIEWNNGWRPSREQVLESIKNRTFPFVTIDVD